MCRLACDENSSWLMVDDWEASQPEYQRTAVVLEHFDREINETYGGVEDEDGAFPFPCLSALVPTNQLNECSFLIQLSGHLACGRAVRCQAPCASTLARRLRPYTNYV